MSNELVPVPDWNPTEINYIIEVKMIVNNSEIKSVSDHPKYFNKSVSSWNYIHDSRRINHCIFKLFSKFIFKTSRSGDPFECLNNIMAKYSELNWKHFITAERENLEPEIIPKKYKSLIYKVKYLKVREPIVSYIEQKIGKDCKGLKELKELFIASTKLTFDEYLDQKSRMLLNLDLKGLENELNKKVKK